MHITYRRTGGVFTLLAFVAAALAALVLTAAAAATVLIVGTAVAAGALGTRAVMSVFSRRLARRCDVIETTLVQDVARMDSDAG